MAVNFGNDTGLELTEETSSATEDRIDALLNGEKPPVEEPDETPEVEPEEAPEPTVEGPSVAMQTVARQAGIPQQLVDLARDDAQLQQYVELANKGESRPQEPEPEFELSLSEDEYGEDDAVRQQFAKMKDHYSGQIATLKQHFGELVSVVKNVQGEQLSQAEQEAAARQEEFDIALDSFDDPTFGKYGELDPAQGGIRGVIFNQMHELQKKHRGTPIRDLAKMAAQKVVPSIKDKNKAATQRMSIQEQSRRKLGAGNSRPAPDPDLTPEQKFFDRLEKYNVRAD
jgi:hypothetical protein